MVLGFYKNNYFLDGNYFPQENLKRRLASFVESDGDVGWRLNEIGGSCGVPGLGGACGVYSNETTVEL